MLSVILRKFTSKIDGKFLSSAFNKMTNTSFSDASLSLEIRALHTRRKKLSVTQDSEIYSKKQPLLANASVSLPLIIQTAGVPIHVYTHSLESEALQQLITLAESGIAEEFVACMPDAHVGVGATIGTVFASRSHISPYAVGSDIGCGMCAVPIQGLTISNLKKKWKTEIQQSIKQRIPTGHDSRSKPYPKVNQIIKSLGSHTTYLKNRITDVTLNQLGTLGSGNHFIEVLYDETEQIWVMLHSGSRRIGKETCDYYHSLAGKQMKKKCLPIKNELKYLSIESQEGQDYLLDMNWCLNYAKQNRSIMMTILCDIMKQVTGYSADKSRIVNIHHNYCQTEDVYIESKNTTETLYITRKGATSARKGQLGIIPGSMGEGSFIVEGLGDPKSFYSCSHGAGRLLSRTEAMKNISQEDFENAMSGITCDVNAALRDECPQAYKDLTIVMANQSSLTRVVHRLKPLVNVKGISARNIRTREKKSKKHREFFMTM